jgi:CheY-like chemotaxis protein
VAPGCGPVLADPTLLNQALMNLCLNARDAMPDGGTLTLAAEPIEVSLADVAGVPEGRAGAYVRVSVTDTGCGMTPAVKARLFEPFFTTKEPGKGTGLGLPMVQGIVKQHRGWVDCTTVPDCGTRIDLYLPAATGITAPVGSRFVHLGRSIADTLVTPPPVVAAPATGPGAGRTVLLVDDEAMIRTLGRVTLERAGYEVLTAEDGADAVVVYTRERDRIDLVVMDVTMPRMSGPEAYRHIVRSAPDARVLFATGYSPDDIAELDTAVGLLNKPYRPAELLAAVGDALTAVPACQTA